MEDQKLVVVYPGAKEALRVEIFSMPSAGDLSVALLFSVRLPASML
jgi:hypothetical protein